MNTTGTPLIWPVLIILLAVNFNSQREVIFNFQCQIQIDTCIFFRILYSNNYTRLSRKKIVLTKMSEYRVY